MKLGQRVWTHMNGAGNTFLMTDARQNPVSETVSQRAAFAKRICSQIGGLTADGLVILEASNPAEPPVDFQWDFYNSDGSPAEMCGNAARCVTRFFIEKIKNQSQVSFQTQAGLIIGRPDLHTNRTVVTMPKLSQPGQFLELTIGKTRGEFYVINTGVPHLVVEGEPVADAALILRKAPELGPAGANVTFYEETTPGHVTAVTFERGVDDFTLACGTGAVAAAAFAREKNPFLKKFDIEMPGGVLTVEWLTDTSATLSGPADFDFEVTLGE